MIPQFSFNFLVYQPNPSRESLHYWVDGEPTRRFMKISDFLELVDARTPSILRNAYDACHTYSFYLYSPLDCQMIHLSPVSQKDEPYPDSINAVVQNKTPKFIGEKRSIEQILSGYGFNVPTDESMQNLRVTLAPQETEREGFVSQIFGRIKRGRH